MDTKKILIFILMFAILSFSVSASYPTTKLISYWSWSDATLYNDSIGPNHMSIAGSVARIQNASCFNGKPCVSVPAGTSTLYRTSASYPTGNNNMTFGCWNYIGAANTIMLMYYGLNTAVGNTIGAYSDGATYGMSDRDAGWLTAAPFISKSWNLEMLEYDATNNTVKIYINGTFRGNKAFGHAGGFEHLVSGGGLNIAGFHNTAGFNPVIATIAGYVGECYLYNRSLTSAEHLQLYNNYLLPNIVVNNTVIKSVDNSNSIDSDMNCSSNVYISENLVNATMYWYKNSVNIYNHTFNNINNSNISGILGYGNLSNSANMSCKIAASDGVSTTTGTQVSKTLCCGVSFDLSLKTGIQNYYDFSDTNNNITDRVAGVRNGTVTGTLGNQNGILGNAKNYTVNPYVSLPNADINAISISIWLRPTSFITTPVQDSFLGSQAADAKNIFKAYNQDYSGSSTRIAWMFANNHATQYWGYYSNNSIPLLTWGHVVLIRNAGAGEIWVNGVNSSLTSFYSSGTVTNGTINTAQPFCIGCFNNGGAPAQNYNGLIDEVAIFNRVITPAEISTLYNGGAAKAYSTWSGSYNTPYIFNISLTTSTCSANLRQYEGHIMNASVQWFKDGVYNVTYSYNNNYANNTLFSVNIPFLFSNASQWICSIQANDGVTTSDWTNSSSVATTVLFSTTPVLASVDNSNSIDSNMNCSLSITSMPPTNAIMYWYKNGANIYNTSFTNVQSSISGILASGNLSANAVMGCKVAFADGTNTTTTTKTLCCSVASSLSSGITNAWTYNINGSRSAGSVDMLVSGATQITNSSCKNSGCYFLNNTAGLGAATRYLYTATVPEWDRSKNWTLSKWFYQIAHVDTGDGDLSAVIADNSGPAYASVINGDSSKVGIHLSSNGASWDIASNTLAPDTVSTGQWYNYIARWNGTNYAVFINGVQKINVASSTAIISDKGLRDGRWDAGATFGFKGYTDELQIYNRALTGAEITSLSAGTSFYPFSYNTPYVYNIDITATACTAYLRQQDGNKMNATVQWYMNGTLNSTVAYNNSYANNTLFSAIAPYSGTPIPALWTCGIQSYDGVSYSEWTNSSILNYTGVTGPSITTNLATLGNIYTNFGVFINISNKNESTTCNVIHNGTMSCAQQVLGAGVNTTTVTCTLAINTNTQVSAYAQCYGASTPIYNSSSAILTINNMPFVTFYNQSPGDINVNSTFGILTNITYNITDVEGIDVAKTYLYFTTNNTNITNMFFTNGTILSQPQNETIVSNTTSLFKFQVDDNQIFPATYNFDEEYMEEATQTFTALTSNSRVKIELLNVSNTSTYNLFEFMPRKTLTNTNTITVYACNSTYSTGDPLTNANCNNIYTTVNISYNHCHHGAGLTCHYVAPYNINITSGKIGTVKSTSTMQFVIVPSGSGWSIASITNITRPTAAALSTNSGVTYPTFSGTFNSHLHQFESSAVFYHWSCATDTYGSTSCSARDADALNLSTLPPTTPVITNPTAVINYSTRNFNITYTQSVSPVFRNVYYNITLRNSDQSFNRTIASNNSNNLSKVYDFSNIEGNFYIRVTACDTLNVCSDGTSEALLIDTINPVLTITAPTNGQWFTIANPMISGIVNDLNFDTLFYTTIGIINRTDGITIAGINYNISTSWPDGFNTVTVYANDSVGNYNQSTITFYVDTLDPVVFITTPIPSQKFTYTNINVNGTYTEANPDKIFWTVNDEIIFQTANITNTSNTFSISRVWPQGTNKITVYVNDSVGRQGSAIVTFSVDSINPALTVSSPINNNAYDTKNIDLNGTISDTNFDNVFFTIKNNLATYTNVTFNGVPPTFSTGLLLYDYEGQNNLTVYANDTYGNLNQTSLTFYVDTINPQIAITSPIQSQKFAYTNVDVLGTYTEINPHMLFWSVDNGATQQTANITNDSNTFTIARDWPQGSNNIIVYVNDTAGRINSSTVSFSVDSINPNIDITSPTNNQFFNYNSVNVTGTFYDVNFDDLYWNINNGVTNQTQNISGGTNCYQEFANQTTACGGLNTGGYASSNLFNDGDWSTNDVFANFNYTIPNSVNNALWQIKYNSKSCQSGPGDYGVYYNYSLSSCIAASVGNKLIFNSTTTTSTFKGSTNTYRNVYCNNILMFNNLETQTGTVCGGWNIAATYYEEATYWNNNNIYQLTRTWNDGQYNTTIYANDTYGNENQSSVFFTVDTAAHNIFLVYPTSNNQTWEYTTDNTPFDATCSENSPYTNISQFIVNCYDESDTLVYGINKTPGTPINSLRMNEANNNLTYVQNFRCEYTCIDQINNVDRLTANITVIAKTTNTNTSNSTVYNKPFTISTSFNFGGDQAICTVIPSDPSVVTCTPAIGSSPAVISCGLSGENERNISWYTQCNSTTRLFLNNINSSSSWMFIDTKLPITLINSPLPTQILANNTPVLFDAIIEDNNTFAVQVNCSLNGVEKYSFVQSNINNRTYHLQQYATFNQIGTYNCLLNSSDDHTNNIFNEVSSITSAETNTRMEAETITSEKETPILEGGEIIKGGIEPSPIKQPIAIEGKIGKLDFSVDKTETPEMQIELIKRIDRVSISVTMDTVEEAKEVPIKYDCPWTAYKRNTNDKYVEHWVCSNGIQGYWIDGNTDKNIPVTSSYDARTKEIKLLYMATESFQMNSIGGLNFNWTYFNFTILAFENLTFTAYNTWNHSTIPVFSVNVTNSSGTTTQYDTTNGLLGVNLINGTYIIQQFAPTYPLGGLATIQTTGVSSSTINTAFWQSQLTIEARELVSRALIPGVSIQTNETSGATYSNTTNPVATGSIMYRINNGSWSSYVAADLVTYAANAGTTGTIASGESKTVAINLTRNYIVDFRREETDLPLNMTNMTVDVIVVCDDETQIRHTGINSTTVSINDITCTYKYWVFYAKYTSILDSLGQPVEYRRLNIPADNINNFTQYFVDLNEGDSGVLRSLNLLDLSGNYIRGTVEVSRFIGGASRVVHASTYDIGASSLLYAHYRKLYSVCIYNNDGAKFCFGDLNADETGSDTLTVPNIPRVLPDQTPDNAEYDFISTVSNNDTSIVIDFVKKNGGTFYSVRWRVINGNGVTIHDYTDYNVTGNVSRFLTRSSNQGQDIVRLEVTKTSTSTPQETVYTWGKKSTTVFVGFEKWDTNIKFWIVVLSPVLIILIFSSFSFAAGMFTGTAILSFFVAILPEWIPNVLISTSPAITWRMMFGVFAALGWIITAISIERETSRKR